MSTILVTGGSGFIGSHMLKSLCSGQYEHRIINADAFTYAARPPMWPKEEQPKNLINVRVDIRDQAAVRTIFEEFNPATVYHFAAESHVCRSISGPKDFATTNMMGTFNMLEESRMAARKVEKFVHISTDEVFGDIEEDEEANESTKFDPRSPYAATKAAADLLVNAWRETYKLRTVIVNMSNVFGPNQHEEKLIPMTINKIINGKEVNVHGDGSNRREWLYVENAIDGITKARWSEEKGSICLGGGVRTSNAIIINKIYDVLAEELPELKLKLKLKYTNDRPTDDKRYALNSFKAKNVLQWNNGSEHFDDNLKRTVQWYVRDILSAGGKPHGRGA